MHIRHAVILFIITTVAGSLLFGSQNPNRLHTSSQHTSDYLPGVVIVKFKSSVPSRLGKSAQSISPSAALASVMQRYSAISARRPFIPSSKVPAQADEEFARIYELKVPTPLSIPQMLEELRKDPSVEYAEPKYVRHLDYTPNDPSFSTQWALLKIMAQQAWDVTKGDSTVVIGIVDSGTDYTHPDLAANIWTNPGETGLDAQGHDKRTNGIDDDNNGYIDDWRGWDFVGDGQSVNFIPDNDPNPYNGNPHGTHTAGIASGVSDNGIGIASIGFRTKLMITKHGVDTPGDNSIYNGDDGILYCINNGANIVSCSWGGAGGSQYEQDIVRYALSKNVLIVASAGNGGDDQIGDDVAILPEYPGAYPGVLSVGATDQQDKIAYFSNYGAPNRFKVFAPGVSILSTVPNNKYDGTYSGTSMSAPLAAGTAALVKAAHPAWTGAQLMFQLCGTSDNVQAVNDPKYAGKMGYGRINAYRAVTETAPAPAPDLAFVSATVDDSQGGNGNGILEPGEKANIVVTLENDWGDASNVTATLSSASWAAAVTQPSSSYGFMRGIMKVDSSQRSNSANPFTISISADAIPTIVPLTIHVAPSNGPAKDFQITVPILPSVLLVDDDDGSNNVEGYYTQALSTLGVVYDLWDHNAKGTPPLDLMMRYKTVIWFTEWNVPTLDSTDRAVLASYLDSGGKKLFLSGEENAWDLCDPTGVGQGTQYDLSGGKSRIFYETYLKGHFVADDAGTSSVIGVTGDEIGDGLSFLRNQPGRGSGQNPDVISPINGGTSIFAYKDGTYPGQSAGVKFKGNYSLVSFSFGGYESIVDSTTRMTVMDRVLKYLLGYSISVSDVADNPSLPIRVDATLTTSDPNQTVELLWTVNGQQPYHRAAMTKAGLIYSGSIVPSAGSVAVRDIEYFVLVKTTDGYLPYTIHKFAVNIPASVRQIDTKIPTEFSLSQNYPNPFNPSTQIRFSVAQTRHVTLSVYDMLGRNVATLINDVKEPGEYSVDWNAAAMSSGVYFYRLEAGTFSSLKSMVLIR
jgi:subtilisin family serine protease